MKVVNRVNFTHAVSQNPDVKKVILAIAQQKQSR